ncbi:MAG: phage scaffolding protein [Bacilli bacterium]
MKREFLKTLGIDDAVIDQIMDENGKDINKSNDKVKSLETEVNNTKTLLENANKEIDSYKSMDIDAIKQSAEDYKNKYETAEQDYQNKLTQMEYDNKLDKYVGTLQLKNDIYKKEVISKIKEKELKFDGDKLLGGEELVNGFKEQYDDAFIDEKPKPEFSDSTQGTDKSGSEESTLRTAMGLGPQK